jgi:hypothetical protein
LLAAPGSQNLRKQDRALYDALKQQLRFENDGGVTSVDTDKLPLEMSTTLQTWYYRRMPSTQLAEPKPAATTTTVKPTEPPIRETFSDDLKRLEKESQRIRDAKEAQARVAFWHSQGLEDSAQTRSFSPTGSRPMSKATPAGRELMQRWSERVHAGITA